jgi:hypothetical protein
MNYESKKRHTIQVKGLNNNISLLPCLSLSSSYILSSHSHPDPASHGTGRFVAVSKENFIRNF